MPSDENCMKTKLQSIGLMGAPNGLTVGGFFSALSTESYNCLVRFAKYRLKCMGDTREAKQCLKEIEAEDLVNQALLKLSLGAHNPSLGRRLKARNLVNLEAFLACVKGVISSDLWNLKNAARHRHEHQPIGDPEHDPDAINPADSLDLYDLLSRREIHEILFKKLYQQVKNKPALIEVVKDWEARFDDDDSIGGSGLNRDQVYRVRQLARDIMAELMPEPPAKAPHEMDVAM